MLIAVLLLQNGKTEYKSVTVAEDSTAEEFMDFYLDDDTRATWVSSSPLFGYLPLFCRRPTPCTQSCEHEPALQSSCLTTLSQLRAVK